MKFEVSVRPRDGQKGQLQRIKGFTTLEDACRTALALAPAYLGSCLVSVWLPAGKRHNDSSLLAVCIVDDERQAGAFFEKARRNLATTLAKRKADELRMKWIRSKDSADVNFSARLFALQPSSNDSPERVCVNQAAITALFYNDFATVEKLMAETAQP